MTLAELLRPFKAKEKTDPDLDRILKAADAGGHGVDLGEMTDQEIIRRLSVPQRSA